MKRITLIVLVIMLAGLVAGVAFAGGNKVTICHNGHTIEISENGLKGHFNADGTPHQGGGHANDHMGACAEPTQPPTPEPTVEQTEQPPVVLSVEPSEMPSEVPSEIPTEEPTVVVVVTLPPVIGGTPIPPGTTVQTEQGQGVIQEDGTVIVVVEATIVPDAPVAVARPVIQPYEDGTCTKTGEEQYLTQTTLVGQDIFRHVEGSWTNITPDEFGLNRDASVINPCAMVSLEGLAGNITVSGLNMNNPRNLVWEGETLRAVDVDADDNLIVFRTYEGNVFVTDAHASFMWSTFEGAYGQVFIDNSRIALIGNDGQMRIMSANGLDEEILPIRGATDILGWNNDGTEIFYRRGNVAMSYNVNTGEFDFLNVAEVSRLSQDPDTESNETLVSNHEIVTIGQVSDELVVGNEIVLRQGDENNAEWWKSE